MHGGQSRKITDVEEAFAGPRGCRGSETTTLGALHLPPRLARWVCQQLREADVLRRGPCQIKLHASAKWLWILDEPGLFHRTATHLTWHDRTRDQQGSL